MKAQKRNEKISTGNVFLENLYNAKVPGRDKYLEVKKSKKEIAKFRKFIYNCNPSFNMLWQMANFIKCAEEVYFYPNSIKSEVYSSRNYTSGSNGFKISSSDYSIVLKLYQESDAISIAVSRNFGDKITTNLEFKNQDWVGDHTYIDELALDHVINAINTSIIKVFDFCYNKKIRSIE